MKIRPRVGCSVSILVIMLGFGAAILGGCSNTGVGSANEDDGAADAPIVRTEMEGWVILSNVDRYTNVAFRCFGPNGIYVPRNPDKTRSKEIVVIQNDTNCASVKPTTTSR